MVYIDSKEIGNQIKKKNIKYDKNYIEENEGVFGFIGFFYSNETFWI